MPVRGSERIRNIQIKNKRWVIEQNFEVLKCKFYFNQARYFKRGKRVRAELSNNDVFKFA